MNSLSENTVADHGLVAYPIRRWSRSRGRAIIADPERFVLSLRASGARTTIYPGPELIAKKWSRVAVDAVLKGSALIAYNIRQAVPGERGHRLLKDTGRGRSMFTVRNSAIGRVILADDRRRWRIAAVTPTFDAGVFTVTVPAEWGVEIVRES